MKKWRFGWTLILQALVLAVAIAFGLCKFWGYLARYEAAHPVGAMNAYFDALKAGDTQQIIADSDFPFDAYNTEDMYVQYLSAKYNQGVGRWQYAEMAADAENGTYTYDVYESDQKYGTLYLQKQEDGWHIRSDWAYAHETVLSAPFVPLVNGAPAQASGEPQALALFEGISGEMPSLTTYTVKTLLPPTVETASGEAVKAEQEDGSARLTMTPTAVDVEKLTPLAEQVARTYACFISQDAKLEELNVYLESGTPFAKAVRSHDNKYYNKHKSVVFENMQVETPIMWSQDIFSVQVSFDFVVSRGYDSHTYPTAYDVAFRRVGNDFKVLNIAPM